MSLSHTVAADWGELAELARSKLAKVLGPERGARVLESTLADLALPSIATPDQLYALSERLVAMGGMEAAVGALLGVAAVIRGAAGPKPRSGTMPRVNGSTR
jgi:hypothetical protein